MFSLIGNLNYSIKKEYVKIDIKSLKEGLNCLDDYIIIKKNNLYDIYDRLCDHQGGKIISKNNNHICPIHGWKFLPEKGKYENNTKKQKKKYTIDKEKIVLENFKYIPKITKINDKDKNLNVRFFNHAFLQITHKKFNFATDPWAIGPAFNTGWWLKYKTKNDWIEKLNKCSFIYLSHNHPDHLHPLTLSKVNKNIPVIVPKFTTDSTGMYAESLGFKNVIRLDFNKEYRFQNTNLVLSLLKSGDFREDSGIYFSVGKFEGLFDVDSNMINFLRLPKVSLYASSFGGGASGYPIMFENYDINEKLKIIQRSRNFLAIRKKLILKEIKPKYYMPYASFFEERLDRDKNVKKINKKISINDYSDFCKKIKTELLDVKNFDEYFFKSEICIKKNQVKKEFSKDLKDEQYLNFYKKSYSKIDEEYIKDYFLKSKFKDNLLLYLSLSDDTFKNIYTNFLIDFSQDKITFKKISKIENNELSLINGKKKLYINCRKESFLNTIYNKQPWEDLLIGFQSKIIRFPNIYNLKFWYHFTNKYITKKNVRSFTECQNCEKISQYFDKLIT